MNKENTKNHDNQLETVIYYTTINNFAQEELPRCFWQFLILALHLALDIRSE